MKTILLGMLIVGLAGSAFAVERPRLEQRIQSLTARFIAMQANPATRVPAGELARAKGIVLLDRTKGAFFVGVHSGNGVALMRDESGRWSPPAFVSAVGASMGPQIGGTRDFFVILAMTPGAAESLKQSSIDLGVQASGTGISQHAGTEASVGSQPTVVVYSQSRGMYAGATLKGGSISVDQNSNAVYYGRPISTSQIFARQVAPGSPEEALINAIEENSR